MDKLRILIVFHKKEISNMKRKKLTIDELRVTSFVTSDLLSELDTVKGGALKPPTGLKCVTKRIKCDSHEVRCDSGNCTRLGVKC